MTRRYFLRPSRIRELIDERHLTHGAVAAHLGVSRAYWSQLVNGHRPLTPTARRKLLDCEIFAGSAEFELWERLEVPIREAS